jgi:hypothetical protein
VPQAAAAKKGATPVTPQQIKHIAQRASPAAPVVPVPKPSYAKAATATAAPEAHKPAITQAHASAGQKLLKALQKEDKAAAPAAAATPVVSTMSPASKVSILKKKIGVVDHPATTATASVTSAAPSAAAKEPAEPVSNGSGVSILAEAAGYSAADIGNELTLLPSSMSMLQNSAMSGVISYQAQQAVAMHKSSLTTAPVLPAPAPHHAAGVHPPAPPVSHTKTAAHDKQGLPHPPAQKLVLNKDATRRIVQHELKPNQATEPAHVKPAASAHAPAVHAEKPKTAPAASAALLATMKQNAKKPAAAAASEAKPAATAAVESAAPAAVVDTPAAPAAAPAKPLTMAEKLANAKKAMKEKQEQMLHMKNQEIHTAAATHHASVAHTTTPAAASAPAAEPVRVKEHAKPDTGKPAVSIVSILTKAKAAKEATPAAAPIEAETVSAPTAAPSAAAVGVSITERLLNAKKAAPAAASAPAPAAASDTAAPPASDIPVPAAPPSTPSAPTGDSKTGTSPGGAKKKVVSNLVPSKLMISKAK